MIYVRATLAAIIAVSAMANAPTADATWFFGPPAKTPCPTTAAPKSYSVSQFQLPFNWFSKMQTAATPCPTTAAPVTKVPETQMAATPCPKTLAPTKASATPCPTTKAPIAPYPKTPEPTTTTPAPMTVAPVETPAPEILAPIETPAPETVALVETRSQRRLALNQPPLMTQEPSTIAFELVTDARVSPTSVIAAPESTTDVPTTLEQPSAVLATLEPTSGLPVKIPCSSILKPSVTKTPASTSKAPTTPCPSTVKPTVTKAPVSTTKTPTKTPASTTKAPVKTPASTPSPDSNVKQVGSSVKQVGY